MRMAPTSLPYVQAEPETDPHAQKPVLIAVPATALQEQALLYRSPLFKWLWQRRPDHVVGLSFFVFDITDEPEAFELLAGWFKLENKPERAEKERRFAEALRKKLNEGFQRKR